jgi:ADP-heptose:LPS heptosyltransferase
MAALQIYDRRERALVAVGDAVLTAAATLGRPFRQRTQPDDPRRILLFRMERIGDLLMVLPAIADVRASAPHAEIHLVVGRWNEELARAIRGIDRVIIVEPAWLARSVSGQSFPSLLRVAAGWRAPRYDVALNFEPDVRSNLMLAATGARWTAGYRSGGGGGVLDQSLDYQPTGHTTDNARRLVASVFHPPASPVRGSLLDIPQASRQEADRLLTGAGQPLIAVHVAGGRPVKQWDPDRFAEVARALANARGATIVLTGSDGDRDVVDRVRDVIPSGQAIDASRTSGLLTTAALLERCDLIITGDTGPMHLAAAVGTPIVAVFGPSDPRRYAPRGPHDRVVRIDLPCAPCNRIRLPPARCTGRTPDCLALLTPDRVLDAAVAILDECRGRVRNVPA